MTISWRQKEKKVPSLVYQGHRTGTDCCLLQVRNSTSSTSVLLSSLIINVVFSVVSEIILRNPFISRVCMTRGYSQ
ncbi:hypothetical protein ARMSODRAFT_735662 [Armillaria solidipes]|uniref:Uncharacterized protein n=1 Tax=Armillaria solidipes TaxID=1076256 RepID=A0A2H3ARB8_9AGAR|nr:hypothetical protein ARMSODRAFT_735662 [Armillaria solidipes]